MSAWRERGDQEEKRTDTEDGHENTGCAAASEGASKDEHFDITASRQEDQRSSAKLIMEGQLTRRLRKEANRFRTP